VKKTTTLEFTVGPGGWLQAMIFAGDGQLESVVAVRLERVGGEWLPDGALYVLPLEPEVLRVLPLRRIVAAVAASEPLQQALAARIDEEVPVVGSVKFRQKLSGYSHPELPRLTRPAGRNLSDDFYAAVADRYREAVGRGLNPRSAIAAAADVSNDVAGRWVREARKRGLLAATEPGKVSV
jgi:hypothetical protein